MEHPKPDQKLKIRLKYTKPETKRIRTHLQPSSSSANFNQEQERIVESDLEEGEIREAHESKLEDPTINQQKDHPIEDKRRICGFCDKVFANGKALGGHLRVHKKKEKDGPDDLSPKPGPEKEVICKYCHKMFHTEKALYGHMRSHPERPHRGMGPPPPLIWKGKGKRSRPIGEWVSTSSSPSSSSFSSGPGRADSVADCLMKMSSNDEDGEDSNHDYYDELMKKIRVSKEGLEKFDDDELYYLQEELGVKICYKSCVLKTSMNFDDFPKIGKENKKRKLGHDDDHGDDDDDHGDDHDDDHDDDEKKGKWVCTTCNKSFATHQALGGHRSSHNKEKNSIHVKTPNSNSIQTLNLTRIVENGYGYGSNRTHVKEVEEVVSHKCKICDQNFPSGQALGGHMRLHYVVPGSGSGSDLGQSSSQTGQGVRGTILDFDLNVAAMAEDVDVAVDSSYL